MQNDTNPPQPLQILVQGYRFCPFKIVRTDGDGSECPHIVDNANSPQMGGIYKMVLLGGHMGPPLRRPGKLGGN